MTRSEAAAFLKDHDNFAILTHHRPDGDTLGCAAFLCLALKSLGKVAYILENPEITPRFRHLHQGLTKAEAGEDDTLVCVDVAAPNMLCKVHQPLLERIALRIDHHETRISFTPLEMVDPAAGACGEILWDIAVEMGVTLDKAMAVALYTAVSTDTGCFRYANTTAHTLLTAAACAETGADLFSLNQDLFLTNSLAKLQLQGWIIQNVRFFRDGKFAICALPRAVEEEIGVTEDDMDNITGFPRSIEGVKMAAMLRQTESGLTKLSVRAVPGYDAAAVCAHFGGGGHKGAAGATTSLPLEEAAQKLESLMKNI